MMVLIDTSVWIDFFAARNCRHVEALEQLIIDREDICLCGVILTEILQGIRKDEEFLRTKNLLDHLTFLPMQHPVFLRSAEMYRFLRQKGITIRKPVDCMIAATAIEYNVPLLHNDRDFIPIEQYCGLRSFLPHDTLQ
ncbi:PIN domain nuclease [Candidatus Electronema sp. PJ]|uniref:type II toxin-antitoxin system VapC family toxin n=1 Tax=Candidatus Electronema sp. PJ TaxID=3401572 RepID=UPI003AA81E3B